MDNATQTGPGVDRTGAPIPDPTANVLALVDAAERRLDDLRVAESHRVDLMMQLVTNHARELREAEAKRIDAIREVDVQAAKAVAAQVATSAETLRSLVDSTAKALAAQMAAQFAEMSSRISSLEKSAYEGAGKGGGQTAMLGWIFSGVLTVGALVSMFFAFNQ